MGCELFSYNNKLLERKEGLYMRTRSGAIHSDSEQNFAKLAQISMNHTGIFYDEKLNRRAMTHLTSKKQPRQKELPHIASPSPLPSSQRRNLFSEFDFNIEFEVIRQQREELERMKQTTRRQINVGILSSDPKGTVQHLCAALGLAESKEAALRGVDLVVGVVNSTIYKYWVFQRGAAVEEDPLLALYLARCQVVLDVKEAEHLVSVVKCTVEGWDGISDSILTPLIC